MFLLLRRSYKFASQRLQRVHHKKSGCILFGHRQVDLSAYTPAALVYTPPHISISTQYRQSHNGFAAFWYRLPAPLGITRGQIDEEACGALNSCMRWMQYGRDYPSFTLIRVVLLLLFLQCRRVYRHALYRRPNLAEGVIKLVTCRGHSSGNKTTVEINY